MVQVSMDHALSQLGDHILHVCMSWTDAMSIADADYASIYSMLTKSGECPA